MKKIFSLFLTLVLLFCIAFECSTQASAVIGIDDAILIGTVCLDLASLGVSIYGVSEFCKSPAFHDFCNSIGNGIDQRVSAIKRSGKLFFATTKMAWQDICNWVKSKFSGKNETKTIEFDTSVEVPPQTITLSDGATVPYGDFMQYPFMIFKSPANGNYCALYCTTQDCGAEVRKTVVQIYCTGTGKVGRFDIENGQWQSKFLNDMVYGMPYKGVPGSVYNFNFSQSSDVRPESFWLYRTMERIINTEGTVDEAVPPASSVPDDEEPSTAFVTASSDSTYYPGAVDSPAQIIEDGELVLIEVPQQMVVGANTANPTVTTDIDVIAQTIAGTTPADVRPVINVNVIPGENVDQIITDTPVPEISGNAETDIETANKFRLPQSFLEGFPFSIPYSVYVGIQSFVADPQAPVFTVPFSIPRLGISENMEIDLTNWNPVARLCRALLSLVWVAGLAMACSKFIKR